MHLSSPSEYIQSASPIWSHVVFIFRPKFQTEITADNQLSYLQLLWPVFWSFHPSFVWREYSAHIIFQSFLKTNYLTCNNHNLSFAIFTLGGITMLFCLAWMFCTHNLSITLLAWSHGAMIMTCLLKCSPWEVCLCSFVWGECSAHIIFQLFLKVTLTV